MTVKGWMTVGDVARHIGVWPETVKRWADAGQLTAYRTLGGKKGRGHRRFLRTEIEEKFGPAQDSQDGAA